MTAAEYTETRWLRGHDPCEPQSQPIASRWLGVGPRSEWFAWPHVAPRGYPFEHPDRLQGHYVGCGKWALDALMRIHRIRWREAHPPNP